MATKRGAVGRNGHHVDLQGGVGQPCREKGLQELQNCTNWAINWVELAVFALGGERFPPQGVQFPRGRSSGLEDGLSNLG